MRGPFINDEAMRSYVAGIDDRTERLLTEAAVSRAISFLFRDQAYLAGASDNPLDLFAFAKAVHAFFSDRDVLDSILSGEVKDLSDLKRF